jgi:phosphoenolpyruvate---glycerone phosphotransferase subunit DhaL
MVLDKAKLLTTLADRILAAGDELTALDAAIGDGDHGQNLRRGFEAVLADQANIIAKSLPEALKALGMTLVLKVGGASGPIYGTLFMGLGLALPDDPNLADVRKALIEAVAAVKLRGKSDFGQKTLLDVWGPIIDELTKPNVSSASIRQCAKASAEATIPMLAIRGRASFLGPRSVGHMDPGARSSQIIIEAILDCLEGKA